LNRVSALAVTLGLAVSAGAQEADLTLVKTVDHVVAGSGPTLIYTLSVLNLGPDTATGMTVTDPLTSDAVFESASPGCSYQAAGHSVICNLPELASGANHEFEIEVLAVVFPNIAEVGVVLTGTASALGQPATAIVGTRYDEHGIFASGDKLVAPRGIEGEAGPTLLVADLVDPSPQSGGVPIADGRVIRIDRSTGAQTLLSSGGELLNPTGIAMDDQRRVFVADPTGPELPEQYGRVIEIDPDSGAQTVTATGILIEQPWGIDVLTNGDLIVADAGGKLVRINPITGGRTLVSEYGFLSRPRAVAQLSPQAVVVADADSGLVRVELSGGAQNVIMPIDGVDLCEPVDVKVDHRGKCWVADPSCGGGGVVLQIDCDAGSVLTTYDDGLWSFPRGIGLLAVVTNRASVTSTTFDPDPSNNSDWVATEIEEGYEPPAKVTVSETVAVSDEVLIEVVTPVVIEILESITVTDVVQPRLAVRIEVSETVTVEDAMAVRPALMIHVVEPIAVSDHPLAAPATLIAVTEHISVTDHVVMPGPDSIFADGFERGDTTAWSVTVGG